METILGLAAATIRVFNITNEELLEAVVDEPVELLIQANYMNVKRRLKDSRYLNIQQEEGFFKFMLVHNPKFPKERYTILNKSPKFALRLMSRCWFGARS